MAHRPRDRKTRYTLGPGGAVFAIVVGLVLGGAIYTQANLLFWGFGLLVGAVIVSLLVSWRALRRIEVQRLLPAHAVAGDALVIRYHLTNHTWMPIFGLQISETWGRGRKGWKKVGPVAQKPAVMLAPPHGWVLHVGPHQTLQAEAFCWPLMRGALSFEQIVLTTSFPFNLIRKTVIVRQPHEIIVYPHLYRVNRRLIHSLVITDVVGNRHTDKGGGHEEFYGLREYRRGDSLRRVDWKHTARTGTLIAREFTKPNPPRLMVLIDLHPWRGNAAAPDEVTARLSQERAISLGASLICDAYLHGYHVGLAVRGAPCPVFQVHHSYPHRGRILEALARVEIDPPETLRQLPAAVEPSVIIVAGAGEAELGAQAAGGGRGAVVAYADEIDSYVIEAGKDQVLSRHVRATSRRDQVKERRLTVFNRSARRTAAVDDR